MSTCLVQIRKEHKKDVCKGAHKDITHSLVCARYLCSDEVFMRGHDLLAPTVTGYMLW